MNERLKRIEGLLNGMLIGDALAMPVHWYYDTERLLADYGVVDSYRDPREYHPDSILFRSSYDAPNPKGQIIHDELKFWGQLGVHYHRRLSAGENTLTAKLCMLVWDSLFDSEAWDPNSFLLKYVDYMTTPGMHNDTYIEECHRNFFKNFAYGKPLEKCAEPEKHVSGLCYLLPVWAYFEGNRERQISIGLRQLELTHPGRLMEEGAGVIIRLFDNVSRGCSLIEAARNVVRTEDSFLLRHRWDRYLNQETRDCLRREFGIACYIENAIPAILYLMLKYGDNVEEMLIQNTMAGGDNVHRGMLLGALAGYSRGMEVFPKRWIDGLRNPFRLECEVGSID